MTSNFTCVVLVWPQSRQLVLVFLQGSKQPPGKQARKGKKTAGKAAKEKHVLFILKVLMGHYHEMIGPREALDKILDSLFANLKSISVINKSLSILHRAL